MSKNKLIPADALHAAKQGFIRTASQSLATSFTITGGLTIAFTGDAAMALGVAAAATVATAALNGAQSFFSILHRGIPEAYAPATE